MYNRLGNLFPFFLLEVHDGEIIGISHSPSHAMHFIWWMDWLFWNSFATIWQFVLASFLSGAFGKFSC